MHLLWIQASIIAVLTHIACGQTQPETNNTYTTRACQAPLNTFPFCNTSLSLEDRITDLIGRLTPEEMVSMLTARHPTNVSAIGLPAWDWGMNAIKGDIDLLAFELYMNVGILIALARCCQESMCYASGFPLAGVTCSCILLPNNVTKCPTRYDVRLYFSVNCSVMDCCVSVTVSPSLSAGA